MSRRRPLLAATLIVRDEERNLPGCLDGLGGLVDEIVIYDTGSTDRTADLARTAGARVILGHWDDDFARARNASLDAVRAEWSLVVDADERVVADAHGVRRLLLGAVPHEPPIDVVGALYVPVVHLSASGAEPAAQFMTRLFRTDAGRWHGRVHETVVFDGPDEVIRALSPVGTIFIEHLGYATPEEIRAKAGRNLAVAQAELDGLVESGSEDRIAGARVLLHLARSFLGVGRTQDAVDALEALREISDGGVYRAIATGLLAQVLLDVGGFEKAALLLEAELRASGHADPRHADWLRAQALAGLGYTAEALELLRGIDAIIDPAGTPLSMDRLRWARSRLTSALAGA